MKKVSVYKALRAVNTLFFSVFSFKNQIECLFLEQNIPNPFQRVSGKPYGIRLSGLFFIPKIFQTGEKLADFRPVIARLFHPALHLRVHVLLACKPDKEPHSPGKIDRSSDKPMTGLGAFMLG